MTNPWKEGYIGVTTRSLQERFSEHKNSDNLLLSRSIKKYSPEIIFLAEGSEQEILELERQYRPEPNIGWNLTIGGGMPPSAYEWWTEDHSKTASDRLAGNSHKLGKLESTETKQKKKDSYHADYENRSFAQRNKSDEWKERAAKARVGKGKGSSNAMASEENRKKVSESKMGRKRIYREDGSFYMSVRSNLR